MKLDRDKFWNLYRENFGSALQPTVDALNKILDFFESETRLKFISWFAYVLATAYHESGINGNHFVPVKEGKAKSTSHTWLAYQSKYWNTGYYGRGLVQTTWKEKYLAVGEMLGVGDLFVKNPDLLLDIKWAYGALVAGMVNGIYRSDANGKFTLERCLRNNIVGSQSFVDSRDIINGDKKKNGLLIAGYALKFQNILEDSQVSAVPNSPKAISQDVKIVPAPLVSTSQPPDISEQGENEGEGATNQNAEDSANESKPPVNDQQTLTKETPSTFTKIAATATAAIGTITSFGINLGAIVQNKIDSLTTVQIVYGVLGLALIALAILWYDRSAQRANRLNQQKLAIASNPNLITTELTSKPVSQPTEQVTTK